MKEPAIYWTLLVKHWDGSSLPPNLLVAWVSVSVVFINGMGRLYCSRSLRSESGVRVGCSSTREGSGVSGCLQRRERIADAAKPREKRRRPGGLTVSSIGSGRFLSYLGAGGFFLQAEGVGQQTEQRSGTRRGWATSYRHGQGLRLPLQAAHHRWQR